MDNKDSCLVENPEGPGIFKTLFLFLQNHNFPRTADTLREEWGLDGTDITKVSNQSVLLTRCKCCKNQGNQTETMTGWSRNSCLEGSFQGERFQLKPNETHVFYICDHTERTDKKLKKTENIGEESLHNDTKKLKSKFSQLQDEHQKLIAVTSELTNALQMNIIGQTKSIYAVLDQCKTIYPSLFDHCCPQMQGDHQNLNMNLENPDELVEVARVNTAKTPQSASHRRPQVENINLNGLSPQATSPLTPEIVHYIMELIFERIFEKKNSNRRSSSLSKEEVEKIITDVLNETTSPPMNCGGGEGEYSAPASISILKEPNNIIHVDYARIKYDLNHGGNEKKIRILQALRWRITKNDQPTREKVLESYATNDLLDLFESISIPERFLLRYGMDHYVQESTCRLINALASLKQGRDYLTLDERLLKRVLIKKVKDVRGVSGAVIRNMLVASVQKLSIRKHCRSQMVEEGLFETMVDYLYEFYDNLSKYCLEYCSALLMNLCLVEEAKIKATKNPKKIVALLKKFLESDNEFCLPYINGVMFSLFEKPDIVREVKNEDLDKAIIKLSQTTPNENIKKQLDFILQSRIFGNSEQNPSEDEDNREEVDLLEAELDQDDYITQLPSGEKLLEEYKTEGLNSGELLRKDPPNSAKSFSEDNKLFPQKPLSDRPIFDTSRNRRYTIWSQNAKTNHGRKNTGNRNPSRFPAAGLCYMENCQKLHNGLNTECSCRICKPGQSKYSCGCYDVIRKDVDGNETHMNHSNSRKRTEAKSGW